MLTRYFDGVIPVDRGDDTDAEAAIHQVMASSASAAHAAMASFAIHEAIGQVWKIVDALNGYLTEQEPWVLAKDDANRLRLARVLYTAADGLRATAILLSPVMPDASQKLWTALGGEKNLGVLSEQRLVDAGQHSVLPGGTAIADLAPLFPRIEPVEA
jgi:methionyl-tRNA synthetase